MRFSNFTVYADESGSPVLDADSKDFPIFVLNFLLVEKRIYAGVVEPALTNLKFTFFGHDQVIFHEREIRRRQGAFSVFRGQDKAWINLLGSLNLIVGSKDCRFIYAIVDKTKLAETDSSKWSPYDIALGMCLERTALALTEIGETGTEVHVIFEARGKKEDQHLELEFRRIADGNAKVSFGTVAVTRFRWTPLFVEKKSNCAGLQIADLAARPLGLSYLRPEQVNRAFSAMRTNLFLGAKSVFP